MSMFEAIHYHKIQLKVHKITDKSMALLDEILKLLDMIEPIDEMDHIHSFWLPVKNGGFDEFKNNTWAKKFFKSCSDRKLKKEYKEEFDEEIYWIQCYSTYNDRYNFKYFKFGDFHIDINAIKEYPRPMYEDEYDCSNCLAWIKEQVLKMIENLKSETYNNYISDNLPYSLRFGIVKRDVYWKYFPDDKEYFLKDLSKEEIERFISIAEKQGDEYKPKERIKDMTFMKYFEWAAIAYKAANYERFSDNVITLFFHYGEDFGSGVLETLDYNSTKDFEDYYYDRLGAMGGHPWGIRRGRSRTRLMLIPHFEGDGYYFEFSGEPTYMIYDMVKMYLALYDLGLPVRICMSKEMIEYLREEDLIGIEPHFYLHIFAYKCYGNRAVRDSRVYEEEDKPEFKKCIEWMPIRELKLKDSE